MRIGTSAFALVAVLLAGGLPTTLADLPAGSCPAAWDRIEATEFNVGPGQAVVLDRDTAIVADRVRILGALAGEPGGPGEPGTSICIQASEIVLGGTLRAGDGHTPPTLVATSGQSRTGTDGTPGGSLLLAVPDGGLKALPGALVASGSGGAGQAVLAMDPSFMLPGICLSTPGPAATMTGGAGGDAGRVGLAPALLQALLAQGAQAASGDGGAGGAAHFLYGNVRGGHAVGGAGGMGVPLDAPTGALLAGGFGGAGGDASAVPCPDAASSRSASPLDATCIRGQPCPWAGACQPSCPAQALVEALLDEVCSQSRDCGIPGCGEDGCRAAVEELWATACEDTCPGDACRDHPCLPACTAPGTDPVRCVALYVVYLCQMEIGGPGMPFSVCSIASRNAVGEDGKTFDAFGDAGPGGNTGQDGDDAGWRLIAPGGASADVGSDGFSASWGDFCQDVAATPGHPPTQSPAGGGDASAGGGVGGPGYTRGGRGGNAHAQGGMGGQGGSGGTGGNGLIGSHCLVIHVIDGADGAAGTNGASGGLGFATGGRGGPSQMLGGDGGDATGKGSTGGAGGHGGGGGTIDYEAWCRSDIDGWKCYAARSRAIEGKAACGGHGGTGSGTRLAAGLPGDGVGHDGIAGQPPNGHADLSGERGAEGRPGSSGRPADCVTQLAEILEATQP